MICVPPKQELGLFFIAQEMIFSSEIALEPNVTDFTQEVGRRIECWCYGQHQPLTNPCTGSLLDCADLSQYARQLFVIGSHLSIGLARYLEPPASFELPLVQTAVGTLLVANDSRRGLSRAR